MLNGEKMLFSGMQATGRLTIGNYLGALKNWVKLSDEYTCLFSVVDEHSITVRQDPAELRSRARNLLTLYIAAGLDPEKNIIYYQSHVSAHAELAWILNCYTYMGELQRMTQFKDKAAKHADNINAGLFTYPVLMASDILLYQADMVPVGQDQMQHIELARDIANRFNNLYNPTFTVPEGFIPKSGARVMSLTDPTRKMSKSDENPRGYVAILDPKDVIIKKFKSAVTDSGTEVHRGEDKPGVNNLINIYCAFTGKTPEEVEKEFEGKGYGEFKAAVGETAADALAPIGAEFARLMNDKAYLEDLMRKGKEGAERRAARTLSKVMRKVGFAQLEK